MIEVHYTVTEKQERMLCERARRTMFKRCSESILQSRVASAVCESELREWIKKYDLCDVCDFSGLHISVAKMLVKCVITVMYKYPRLRGRMNFIGSRKGYMELLDKLSENDSETVRVLGIQYIMDTDSVKSIGNSGKQLLNETFGSRGNTLAEAISFFGIIDGILIDEADFNSKEIRNIKIELERAMLTRHFPKGCASVESVIYHEIGHIMDYLCRIRNRRDVISEFNAFTKEELTNNLSSYATVSVAEYIAEGFSECMSSSSPRAVATTILRHIDECYKSL